MLYFAYGSNMDPDQMKERGVEYSNARRAVLEGHRLVFDRYSKKYKAGVADIIPDPTNRVEGVLYEVDENGLYKLDQYEGVEAGMYRRVTVRVSTDDGTLHDGIAYEVVEKSVEFMRPAASYLEKIVRGAVTFRFSEAYVEMLRCTESKTGHLTGDERAP